MTSGALSWEVDWDVADEVIAALGMGRVVPDQHIQVILGMLELMHRRVAENSGAWLPGVADLSDDTQQMLLEGYADRIWRLKQAVVRSSLP